jgi:hypothetical protein
MAVRSVAGAARGMFSQAKDAKGFFGKVGAIGRKNVSTMDPKMLARSGKVRSAAVAGGVMGVGAMRSRRGPGVSKSSGRPTGMYGY